jgi:hypothetical protein
MSRNRFICSFRLRIRVRLFRASSALVRRYIALTVLDGGLQVLG